MQTKRDSTVAVERTEVLKEVFEAAIADGKICDIEMARLRRKIANVEKAVLVADTATALSVNVGRGGLDGDRFVELSTDYRRLKAQLHAEPLDAA